MIKAFESQNTTAPHPHYYHLFSLNLSFKERTGKEGLNSEQKELKSQYRFWFVLPYLSHSV